MLSGPVKALKGKFRYESSVSFVSEPGSIPLKWHKERSSLDNCLKLLIESGNVPEKLVLLTIKLWRDLFNAKSSSEPRRSLLQDMSIMVSVLNWKICSGNLPFNPQSLSCKLVKFEKLASSSGSGADKLF